jgi:hypothetical protein
LLARREERGTGQDADVFFHGLGVGGKQIRVNTDFERQKILPKRKAKILLRKDDNP